MLNNQMEVYLDCAATTKPNSLVAETIYTKMIELWHNPSSLYKPSIKTKQEIEYARKITAESIGAHSK